MPNDKRPAGVRTPAEMTGGSLPDVCCAISPNESVREDRSPHQVNFPPSLFFTGKLTVRANKGSSNPSSGNKVWEALNRKIGKAWENRGQIVAHWEFQPAAAFYNLAGNGHDRTRATAVCARAVDTHVARGRMRIWSSVGSPRVGVPGVAHLCRRRSVARKAFAPHSCALPLEPRLAGPGKAVQPRFHQLLPA